MCRLFGFRSNAHASVHPALVTERNSLRMQSIEHRDGWGIAHYDEDGQPRVVRGLGPALGDPEFQRVSSVLSAQAVVAHLRLASVGSVEICNAHPFIRGRWTFAHNGTLRDFHRHQAALEARVAPGLRGTMESGTDSERAFLLFLTHLDSGPETPVTAERVARALARTMRDIASVTDTDAQRSAMNFLVTDGRVMVATRRDKTLFFAARPASGEPVRTAPTPGAPLSQLVVASEQLSLHESWFPVQQDELLGVEADLVFRRWSLNEL